jgi:sirohydrochlorin cobaltochelatase
MTQARQRSGADFARRSSRTTIVVVGHGSRDPAANAEFEAMVDDYRRMRSDCHVVHGYLELATPSLPAALAQAAAEADRVVVLPLVLFAAGHVKNDLPLAVAEARREHPDVVFDVARPLGVHPLLTEVLFERAASSSFELDPEGAARTAVVVVGRGSSDPDANGDFCKLVRLFGEGRGFARVEPAFMGITRPLVDDVLELTARARPERLLVVPALLLAGTLVGKLRDKVRAFAARYPWIRTDVAAHLGADRRVLELLDERLEQALAGEAPLPCDTCQYRTALPGLSEQVGGVKALLWSIRHGYTHTQAAPHLHAHKPLRKHVLVCGNVDCVERGSIRLIEELRRLIQESGRQQEIRVTRTSCMGRCGEGPTVAVYPDGIWYRGVRAEDAAEVVGQHLLCDQLVARLVDNIMQ